MTTVPILTSDANPHSITNALPASKKQRHRESKLSENRGETKDQNDIMQMQRWMDMSA